ncbi:MAG: hypothetical protein R2847_11450 [Bacteroidia bacterium]
MHEIIIKAGVLSGFTALILLLQYSGTDIKYCLFIFRVFQTSFKVSAERYAGAGIKFNYYTLPLP